MRRALSPEARPSRPATAQTCSGAEKEILLSLELAHHPDELSSAVTSYLDFAIQNSVGEISKTLIINPFGFGIILGGIVSHVDDSNNGRERFCQTEFLMYTASFAIEVSRLC